MKKNELKKILFSGFKDRFSLLGFKKSKYGFIKLNGDYAYEFNFSSVDRHDCFPSTFSYSVGSKSIGNILKNIIKIHEDNVPYYMMRGGGIVSLYEAGEYPMHAYNIYTEGDANKMIEEVSSYFVNTALPYLESISSLEALEKLTNHQPHPYGIRTGPLLAKLVGNPNCDTIIQQYRESLKSWVVEWDKKDFENIVAFLDSHSVEELMQMASD